MSDNLFDSILKTPTEISDIHIVLEPIFTEEYALNFDYIKTNILKGNSYVHHISKPRKTKKGLFIIDIQLKNLAYLKDYNISELRLQQATKIAINWDEYALDTSPVILRICMNNDESNTICNDQNTIKASFYLKKGQLFFIPRQRDFADYSLVFHATPNAKQLYGSTTNDLMIGHKNKNELFGGNGNDRIFGCAGDDYIHGGNGNDTLDGGKGDDTITGQAGNDYMTGKNGNDHIFGGDGNDSIDGGSGNDYLAGGNHDDYIHGDIGHDDIHGDAGDDRLLGGDGHDIMDGGAGDDFVRGGDGHDLILGSSGNDVIHGGNDSDFIILGQGENILYGESEYTYEERHKNTTNIFFIEPTKHECANMIMDFNIKKDFFVISYDAKKYTAKEILGQWSNRLRSSMLLSYMKHHDNHYKNVWRVEWQDHLLYFKKHDQMTVRSIESLLSRTRLTPLSSHDFWGMGPNERLTAIIKK